MKLAKEKTNLRLIIALVFASYHQPYMFSVNDAEFCRLWMAAVEGEVSISVSGLPVCLPRKLRSTCDAEIQKGCLVVLFRVIMRYDDRRVKRVEQTHDVIQFDTTVYNNCIIHKSLVQFHIGYKRILYVRVHEGKHQICDLCGATDAC